MQNSNIELIKQNRYSSLLNRFLACLIDYIILLLICFVAAFTFGIIVILAKNEQILDSNILDYSPMMIYLIYEVYYLSSKKQATIGQRCRNIIVSTKAGGKITIMRAICLKFVSFSLYLFLFYLSFLLYFRIYIHIHKFLNVSVATLMFFWIVLGIIIIIPYFLTQRKQLLHDWLVGVVVLQEPDLNS